MSHPDVRSMSDECLQYWAQVPEAFATRELLRRNLQMVRSEINNPPRKPRARSQPGGNPRFSIWQDRTSLTSRRVRLGRFIPYAEVQLLPRPTGKRAVDFDVLAKVPVEKIYAHCLTEKA